MSQNPNRKAGVIGAVEGHTKNTEANFNRLAKALQEGLSGMEARLMAAVATPERLTDRMLLALARKPWTALAVWGGLAAWTCFAASVWRALHTCP